MVNIQKELLIGISIPIIFTIAIVAFFSIFLPKDQTLGNFISYLSSLATILMVLVVVVTTSLQLKEMQSSKLLQTQPFPAVKPLPKTNVEKLRLFYGVPESKTFLMRRVFFFFEVENIGNAPIVAVDIIPQLTYTNADGSLETDSRMWVRIDSLKPNEKLESGTMFNEPNVVEPMLRSFITSKFQCGEIRSSSSIELIILYKNILGASFKQRILFDVFPYREDIARIKSCIRLLETIKIDYSEELGKIESQYKHDREKAVKMLDSFNDLISKQKGCEEFHFGVRSRYGEFSIRPISEKEYQKYMRSRRYGATLGVEKPKEIQDSQEGQKEAQETKTES